MENMINSTPPISKTQGFLRIILILLCIVSFFSGIVFSLMFVIYNHNIDFKIGIALISISFITFLLLGGFNFFIKKLEEYQVIKITTQIIGIEQIIVNRSSFSVQQRIFNIIKYKFEWITISENLTEKEAIANVNNKFIKLEGPVTEVIYKKP